MIVIKVDKLEYSINQFDFFPIPTGLCFTGEIKLVGRLHSTRGGGASWYAGTDWKPHINTHLFEPRVNAVVLGTIETYRCRDKREVSSNELIITRLAGYSGRDIVIVVSAKYISSTRPLRKAIFDEVEVDGGLVEERQGHLTVRYVSSLPLDLIEAYRELKPEWAYCRPEVVEMFNHEIFGADEVIGFDNKKLIYVERAYKQPLVIVSRDHLDRPLKNYISGWYLLEHPLPFDID